MDHLSYTIENQWKLIEKVTIIHQNWIPFIWNKTHNLKSAGEIVQRLRHVFLHAVTQVQSLIYIYGSWPPLKITSKLRAWGDWPPKNNIEHINIVNSYDRNEKINIRYMSNRIIMLKHTNRKNMKNFWAICLYRKVAFAIEIQPKKYLRLE